MTNFDSGFRRATLADVAALAELVELAGEGLPLALWTQLSDPGGDPWEVGRQRVSSETTSYSYRNALIAERAGKSVGALLGYPLGNEPEPIDGGMPALLVPLHELMNMAPGTWYVHALAAYPEYRGRGIGTECLREADRRAAAAGTAGLSLVVSDTNTGARRLYERWGYREAARRRMVKQDWQHPGTDWVLLTKRAVQT
jgi:ribosomal protein S18 acetylase RimI-like enzyme